MTLATLLQYAGALALVVGPVGPAIEAAGSAFKIPWLEAVGQRMEAFGADLPKLMRGSRFTSAQKIGADIKDDIK